MRFYHLCAILLAASVPWSRVSLAATSVTQSWELQTDPRKFYFPGYHIERAISFRQDEISGPTGLVQGYRFVPLEQGEELSGAARTKVQARLDQATRACSAAAKGPDGEFDRWLEFSPNELVVLKADGSSKSQMMLYRGYTSYEGTEDQDPGSFQCVLRDGKVWSWTFRSFDDRG